MRHLNRRLLTALLMVAAVMMAACNRTTVYHHYEPTSPTGWEKDDTLFFYVPRAQCEGVLHEEVELRTNSSYPYMGLSLVVRQTVFPSGVSRTDTLNCSLVDESGAVKGQGVSLFQYHFHLTDLSLSEGDSVSIAIRHNMRREILPGIADIGICLTRYH
jgi:gliding motility-associated lipoprotein GldH